MFPETCDYILSCIEHKLQRTTYGTPMIPPRTLFLLALWRLATPDSFRSICERFNIGRSTALYITRRVVKALVELTPIIIKWLSDERVNEVWAGFENTSGFPKVIGAIDGTHINIPAPRKDPECYINRKGHHSIQLQAICDHKCQFTHCYVGHVGSVHDQRVFRQSEVQSYLGNATKFPQDSHLIDDSAYKLHQNMMIPYRDNGHLTHRQKNYNFCHASTRIVIERAFGLLKGRFRSLLTIFAMDRVDLIPVHILACCILHNICIMRGDEIDLELNMEETMDVIEDNAENVPACAGSAKRDMISKTLRIRHV
ncbi:putative nuclease HARBI1 [Monomorium pharaonis]|uniref:putative nuclease HARBI1 n=1 Tax=Monomorium pharaonis TaxID=307658 RepID=UPI00063F1AED|nr:putative nuclease HARBI1 [Monomorium pharaonis]XP_012528096.1 putative nuclease HARBI1 [Monomorium pharaonis]